MSSTEADEDDVLFASQYGIRSIELNRPAKLNALNGSMVEKIAPRLKEWEKSDLANMIIISGAGPKSFCAGGDVANLAMQNKKGPEGQKKSKEFFSKEYQLDHLIATYSKPYIAVMDGITMGGGVGLSVHAPIRIATEKTVFAMPETTIGFFPDVGGSFFLPRLDGEIGTYLALTSERLKGVQAFYAGIATHYMHSSTLPHMFTRLSELVFKDHLPLADRLELINQTMAEFSTGLPEEPILLGGRLRNSIDRCFSPDTVEGIFEALRKEKRNKGWAQKTLETLSGRSPTSLKVTLRQLRASREWTISETFQREEKIAGHFMEHPDFVEGVSAKLINKPPTEPAWKPATLAEVTEEAVDNFFRIPEGETRMKLLNPDADYKNYPHEFLGLPSQNNVEKYFRDNRVGKTELVEAYVKKTGNKDGVREKVSEIYDRKVKREGDKYVWVDAVKGEEEAEPSGSE